MQMWPEGLAGIEIKVDGFSHKLPLLVDYIFQQLVSLKVHPDRFERIREGLVRRYKNANFKPDKHATYLRLYAIKQKMWPVEVVQAQLESLTPSAVQGKPSSPVTLVALHQHDFLLLVQIAVLRTMTQAAACLLVCLMTLDDSYRIHDPEYTAPVAGGFVMAAWLLISFGPAAWNTPSPVSLCKVKGATNCCTQCSLSCKIPTASCMYLAQLYYH